VRDGLISAVGGTGTVRGSGKKEIDAGGKLVTPGWVDVHSVRVFPRSRRCIHRLARSHMRPAVFRAALRRPGDVGPLHHAHIVPRRNHDRIRQLVYMLACTPSQPLERAR
jgi:hypothetical protein